MIRRLLDRLVVAWCRISGSHFIEPWIDLGVITNGPGHSGCSACTWCVECGCLLGRDAVDIWS